MSSVQLRRLSQELVRLRKEAGLTVEEVTRAMDWSTGRLTYYELAKWQRADVGNVMRLLDHYGVTGDRREGLLDLARQTKIKGWWAPYRDIFPASYPGFEDAATAICSYEGLLIPGLLQTRGYVAAIMSAGQVLTPEELERRVTARLARQRILSRDRPPQLWTIVDESALLRLVGGAEVMREQIRHLIEVGAWPHITIQVARHSAGAHAAMTGAFVLLDFAGDDPSLVYLEGATSSLFMEKPEEVQAYTLIFNRVVTSALSPEESMGFLAELRDRLD